MLKPLLNRSVKPTLFTLALAIVFSGPVWSCGPYYPESVFTLGDESVLHAPAMSFSLELKRILEGFHKKSPKKNAEPEFYESQRTLDAGLSDLMAALKFNKKVTASERKELKASITKLRKQLDKAKWSSKAVVFDAVPAKLPADFRDYLVGAVHYRKKELEKARQSWQRILDRSDPAPRYRTVWALFMLGKSFKETDPKKAILYFKKTRNFAKSAKKYPDSLGLSNASLGWEAYCQLKLNDYKEALSLYARHLETGHYSAAPSISQTCFRALKNGEESVLKKLADDPLCRAIVTAYVVSHVDQDSRFGLNHTFALVWLEGLEKQASSTRYGDKLAWTFYRLGRFNDAKRWLKRTEKTTALSAWLLAKLQLRAGQIDLALKELDRALALFPKNERWEGTEDPQLLATLGLKPRLRIHGEMGVLELSLGRYVNALDHLYKAGYWWDAAYIAESVLTTRELKEYVDLNCPKNRGEDCLRYLLGRRLVRAKKWSAARRYLPKEHVADLDAYLAAMKLASDFTQTQSKRSEGLWNAAKKVRYAGMELMGTELAPDWFVLGGNFSPSSIASLRKKRGGPQITSPLSSELRRAAKAKPTAKKRFHYRYKAAELAWNAASLMPNNDDKTAARLNEAGTWLKYRDPKSADRFYKALVNRCGKTILGAKARKKRWFP